MFLQKVCEKDLKCSSLQVDLSFLVLAAKDVHLPPERLQSCQLANKQAELLQPGQLTLAESSEGARLLQVIDGQMFNGKHNLLFQDEFKDIRFVVANSVGKNYVLQPFTGECVVYLR